MWGAREKYTWLTTNNKRLTLAECNTAEESSHMAPQEQTHWRMRRRKVTIGPGMAGTKKEEAKVEHGLIIIIIVTIQDHDLQRNPEESPPVKDKRDKTHALKPETKKHTVNSE